MFFGEHETEAPLQEGNVQQETFSPHRNTVAEEGWLIQKKRSEYETHISSKNKRFKDKRRTLIFP